MSMKGDSMQAAIDNASATNDNYEQIGIPVIAHGSPDETWNGPIRDAVANVSFPYPTELGFLEYPPSPTINIAVDKLNEHNVTKIIFPIKLFTHQRLHNLLILFPCSHRDPDKRISSTSKRRTIPYYYPSLHQLCIHLGRFRR